MGRKQIVIQKEIFYNKTKGLFLALLTLGIIAAIFWGSTETAHADYAGDVNMDVEHAKDCPCGFAETGINYFIPGSVHKFNLVIKNLSSGPQVDKLLGFTHEWLSNENAILQKEEGTSAWYRLEGLSKDTEWDYFTIEAPFSCTGYTTTDGKTVMQDISARPSRLFFLLEDFWLTAPSCNPTITVRQNAAHALKLYGRHFTVSHPYGEIVDITSWVDWSKVGISGIAAKVHPNGTLEASSCGEFKISVYQAINQSSTLPQGIVWRTVGSTYCIFGVVVPGQQPVNTGNNFTSSNGNSYRITAKGSRKTVTFSGNRKNPASLAIPDTVTNSGTKYQVTAIADKALKGSLAVKSVTIGKNIASIGKEAFSGCKNLSVVKGCTKVTSVGSKAFYNCTKLKTIGKSNGSVVLASIKAIGSGAFSGCKSVKKVSLTSAALTKIDSNAFYGCTALSGFTAKSANLKTIGRKAFCNDRNLKSVSLKTKKLTNKTVGADAFKKIKSTCTFKVPAQKVSSYKKLFRSKGAGSKIRVVK